MAFTPVVKQETYSPIGVHDKIDDDEGKGMIKYNSIGVRSFSFVVCFFVFVIAVAV